MDYSMEEGDTIPGRQVARVVESRHKMFTKGKVTWYKILETQIVCVRLSKHIHHISLLHLPTSIFQLGHRGS